MKKISAVVLAVIVCGSFANVTRAEDEKQDVGKENGGGEKESNGKEDKDQPPPPVYKLKKVVKYKTVTEYVVRKEKYVKCETAYDECDKPHKVYKTCYRDVKVPVKKEVPVVTWVRVVCPMKKVVTCKTVTEYVVRKEKYVKCETAYDEYDKPHKVYKTCYRDVKVPVKKKIYVVTWVPDCSGGEYRDEEPQKDSVPPVPDE